VGTYLSVENLLQAGQYLNLTWFGLAKIQLNIGELPRSKAVSSKPFNEQ
jgi:hypothetical protein